jgi:transcriptional regulator with XRE-family HTH domain
METPGGYPFGDVLRGFRTRAHISQTELAEKLGVTRLTISNWEAGNNLPKRRQVKEIADATACIQHLLLRILLWRAKYIPWGYPHFLDEMAERLILCRVGGGGRFLTLKKLFNGP